MTFKPLVFLLIYIGSCAAGAIAAADLVLIESAKSPYQIVVAEKASPSTKHAAEELQKYLEEIAGAKLPIVPDSQPVGAKEIILGDSAHFRSLKTNIDIASLGKEGYVIRTVGDHLVIAGSDVRGSLYGVYGLLEDHMGCRWFTPDCSRIPKTARLVIGETNDRQIPALEYRELFMIECVDGDWCARNRTNSSCASLEAKHGGKILFGNCFFVHSFQHMVPPDKYFAEHPEYFSLVNGKRLKDKSQLCCTNPDVIRICTEKVLEGIRQQPEATVFSVSQNDCDAANDPPNYCECANCQAVAKQEGSQMGPVLLLVNKVAEAVEKEAPEKIIETLAYQWTRTPPKQIRPRPNVVVRLCSIECCFTHPLAACNSPENERFRADIAVWSKAAPRLWIWDYTTSFKNYLIPFPNQYVLGENIRFFVNHNVKGLFEQDNYQTVDGEFSALGGYIEAKCLWNPNYDANKAMKEFLEAYYGKASAPIGEYLAMLHKYVTEKNVHMMIFFGPGHEHACLPDDLLMSANLPMQQAEEVAVNDAVVLTRVKSARMSLDYAIVERARSEMKNKLPANDKLIGLARDRFTPFTETLKKSALKQLGESWPLDKDVYCRDLAVDLQVQK